MTGPFPVRRIHPQRLQNAFMQVGAFRFEGAPLTISRSGYTGEDGFEILVAANRAAILRAGEWRIGDWRERIACLKTSMAQEAKSIAVKFIRAALGDDVYDAAGRATKLRRKRIRYDLKLLDCFLAHRGTRRVD